MKCTIERVNPNSVAKVISVAAALLFLLFLLVALAVNIVWGSARGSGVNLSVPAFGLVTILLPFIYMVSVYIASYIVALAFNAALRLVGGIQFELSD